MIEQFTPPPRRGPETRWVLRPDRALTGVQMFGLFAALAVAMGVVAIYSYTQGNAFAPAFAVLHTALIGVLLRLAWRAGDRYEVVEISGHRVQVSRSRDPEPAFTAHPGWVRLDVEDCRGDARVLLASAGRRVEVGAFLAAAERRRLAHQLREGLMTAAASGRHGSETTGVNP